MERMNPIQFVTPEITSKLDVPDVSLKLLQSHFKNAKQFFEGDGKSKLRADLENRMNTPVADIYRAANGGA